MIQIAISLLALAAGVHLLIQVKQAGLSALYRNLAWLVVLLSLGFISCGVARGILHIRHMRQCEASGQCSMSSHDNACPYMKGGHADCCQATPDCCRATSCSDTKEQSSCCKDMKAGATSCGDHTTGEGKSSCCQKMASDSTAKK